VVRLASRRDPGTRDTADTVDVALVAAAQADPLAFDELYERYADPILNYCYYRLGSWEEAEDAAQQIFINAYGALSRFQDRQQGSFRSWLFTLAHNEVANRRRGHARHPTFPLTEALVLRDPAPMPEELAVIADAQERVRTLLAGLSDDQRRVLELRVAGLTDVEIAAVLGRTRGAVRGVQARGVARLRALPAMESLRQGGHRG
jgi:RNA polymerase sigma-70 factor (ECF subfamily)